MRKTFSVTASAARALARSGSARSRFPQPQQCPARHGQRKLGIFHREPTGGDGGSDVATRAWGQSAV
jgi:hypothetical protein